MLVTALYLDEVVKLSSHEGLNHLLELLPVFFIDHHAACIYLW